jgi:RAT1-interacting protein
VTYVRYSIIANYHKWYIQSCLLGTPEIFVGYRDSDNVLRYTESVPVTDIPGRLMLYGIPWDPQQSIDWGFRVLTALRIFCQNSEAAANADERVWRVEVRPLEPLKAGLYIRELSAWEVRILNETGDQCDQRRTGIIPEWLVNEIRKK